MPSFSTSMIASLAGAVFSRIDIASSHEVTAGVNAAYESRSTSIRSSASFKDTGGKECLFVATFKATDEDLDLGVLGCLDGEFCVEDTGSSLGGRCVDVDGEYVYDYDYDFHRRLSGTPCTFANGTDGFKCVGDRACGAYYWTDVNLDNVACGSCIGRHACYAYGTTTPVVAEGSCVGVGACYAWSSFSVGINSCIGDRSCSYFYGNEVGDNACQGDKACYYADINIGDCQCNGYKSCYKSNDSELSADVICADELSESPSNAPSLPPSFVVSESPSDLPSEKPTLSPSVMLSGSPSSVVSSVPSESPSSSPTSLSLSCPPKGKKVKVQSVTGVPISMFEVEVFSSGSNVALGKSARQSSNYLGRGKFAASKAVDGNKLTFSHTNKGRDCGWWEVYLDETVHIDSIKITNRWCGDDTDPKQCLCKLSFAAVSILDERGRYVDATLTENTCGVKEWEHVFASSPDHCDGA